MDYIHAAPLGLLFFGFDDTKARSKYAFNRAQIGGGYKAAMGQVYRSRGAESRSLTHYWRLITHYLGLQKTGNFIMPAISGTFSTLYPLGTPLICCYKDAALSEFPTYRQGRNLSQLPVATIYCHYMDYQKIIDKAGEFVSAFMGKHENPKLLYHNRAHTESVVSAVTQIARHSHLSHRELFITMVAAWFTDIGYYVDVLNPRPAGAGIAEEFLQTAGVEPDTAYEVKKCLLATDLSHQPVSLPEQVVRDAVFFYLGTDHFAERNRLMRKETEAVHGICITKEEWRHRSANLLESHHYHTGYCQQLLSKKKKQNLEKLKKRAREHSEDTGPMNQWQEEELPSLQPDTLNGDDLRLEKGSETLFRVASANSQRLSEQADQKANILISVNAIIMSILLSVVVTRLERYPHLTLPIILFLLVNLVTITYSVLATRPSVPKGLFDRSDIDNRKVNLLFFGNFYRMNFDDYSTGMYKVLGDRNYLYFSFIKNLYEHGVVLGRKYRRLKVAYNIFMYGIIVSVIAFVIASQYFAP